MKKFLWLINLDLKQFNSLDVSLDSSLEIKNNVFLKRFEKRVLVFVD